MQICICAPLIMAYTLRRISALSCRRVQFRQLSVSPACRRTRKNLVIWDGPKEKIIHWGKLMWSLGHSIAWFRAMMRFPNSSAWWALKVSLLCHGAPSWAHQPCSNCSFPLLRRKRVIFWSWMVQHRYWSCPGTEIWPEKEWSKPIPTQLKISSTHKKSHIIRIDCHTPVIFESWMDKRLSYFLNWTDSTNTSWCLI